MQQWLSFGMNLTSPFFIWLLVVSFFSLLVFSFSLWVFLRLNRLIKDSDNRGLVKVFQNLVKNQKKNEELFDEVFKKVESLEKKNVFNIQKVGLVRFNPFSEIGGDHSFSLALLNGKDSGFVITGLHTRERTRLYIKPIKKLESSYGLSEEEKKAIKEALKKKND